MKKHPFILKMLGLFMLIVPTIIYLIFLIPNLSEEYTILMSSGGMIGGVGFVGSSKIPEKLPNSGLFKLASTSFTILIIITLVEEFIMELVFLVATIIVSYIVYKIIDNIYKKLKRLKENEQLAQQITSSINSAIK